MKSLFLAAFMFLSATVGFAQKTNVEEIELTVNGVPRKGQRINIQLDSKLVDKAWQSHLKEKAGKMSSSKGVYTIEQGKIESIAKTPLRIVSKVDAGKEGTMVWWSLDLGSSYVNKSATPEQYAAAETFIRDFARKLYREDIARQVAEAEKVLANTQSEEARVIKASEDLKRDIERNKLRKTELEAELNRNAQDLVQLNKDTETNVKQQEAAKQNVANMKQAVDVVKNKVNLIE